MSLIILTTFGRIWWTLCFRNCLACDRNRKAQAVGKSYCSDSLQGSAATPGWQGRAGHCSQQGSQHSCSGLVESAGLLWPVLVTSKRAFCCAEAEKRFSLNALLFQTHLFKLWYFTQAYFKTSDISRFRISEIVQVVFTPSLPVFIINPDFLLLK